MKWSSQHHADFFGMTRLPTILHHFERISVLRGTAKKSFSGVVSFELSHSGTKQLADAIDRVRVKQVTIK